MVKNKETKLKKILQEKRISQTELYNLIKQQCKSYLGRDVISRIVNGKKTNYELYTLLKICCALNCTPNQIIEKDDFVRTQIRR
jgi:DNA-binding Xre family transcriptional regulator